MQKKNKQVQHLNRMHRLIHYVQKKYFEDIFLNVWISLHPKNEDKISVKQKQD